MNDVHESTEEKYARNEFVEDICDHIKPKVSHNDQQCQTQANQHQHSLADGHIYAFMVNGA